MLHLDMLMITLLILLSIHNIDCYSSSNVINKSNRLNNNIRTKYNSNTLHMTSMNDDKSTKWDLSLRSPCKINLFLRILGRRPTGYRKLITNIYYY
jgi:hypothetical protein